MVGVTQRAFTGGEVAPGFQSRVDQARYSVSLKSCRNFIVLRQGGVTNRAGTEYICEHKAPTRQVKLVKFVFSTDQTYVLLFGHQYMRVVQNGILLQSSGVPYEIATPYEETKLSLLQYAQTADLVTLTHPDYTTRELKRLGHTNWTLTALSPGASIATPTGVTATQGGAGSIVFDYVITAVALVTYEESSKSSVASCTGATPTDAAPNTINWSATAGAAEYRVFRSVNGVYGYIGTAVGTTFKDPNINPDMLIRPPIVQDPTSQPAAVGYYQQRRLLAGSNAYPETVFASRSGLYSNFWRSRPTQADDAITFQIASRKVQRIRHLMELDKLVIFTSEGIWAIDGGADGALLPDAINPRLLSDQGADTVSPVMADSDLLYLEDRGTILRSLSTTTNERGKYTGLDRTILANHLFEGRRIVAMDYQRLPHSVLWCVLSDGQLLGLTYMPEHDIWGWHRHDTNVLEDGRTDVFEDVCVVPEGEEDAVYVTVVRRRAGERVRYLERIAPRRVTDPAHACFLDSALRYDGTNTNGSHFMQLMLLPIPDDLDWNFNQYFSLFSNVAYFTAEDIGTVIVLKSESLTSTYGDGISIPGPFEIKCTVVRYESANGVDVTVSARVPATFRDARIYTWARAITNISGLSHLNEQGVGVLADGNVVYDPLSYSGERDTTRAVAQFSVLGGQLTPPLPYPASKVVVGLPITAEIETLEIDTVEGASLATKKKRVGSVTAHLHETRGLWVGRRGSKMWEIKSRQTPGKNYNEPTPARTAAQEVKIGSGWHNAGSLVLRQIDPLPATVLAVSVQLEMDDSRNG